jgi:PncC family amidohydrolase
MRVCSQRSRGIGIGEGAKPLNIIDLASAVGRSLSEAGRTIAVAESCTGGDLSHALSTRSGASAYFLGGVIAYHNDVKVNLLGVPSSVIERFGAVSKETVEAMAAGCRERFDCDVAAAITGIAGPTGGTPDKPVGLVYIAAATRQRIRSERLSLVGDRSAIRNDAAIAALKLAQSSLDEDDKADPPSSLIGSDPTG